MSSEGKQATGTMVHDETGEELQFSTQIKSDGSFLLPVQHLQTGLWHVKLNVPITSSEGKRYWVWDEDLHPERINEQQREMAPASEVERLKGELKRSSDEVGRLRKEMQRASERSYASGKKAAGAEKEPS